MLMRDGAKKRRLRKRRSEADTKMKMNNKGVRKKTTREDWTGAPENLENEKGFFFFTPNPNPNP